VLLTEARSQAGNPPERFADAFRSVCSEVVALPHAGEIAPGPGLGPASDAQLKISYPKWLRHVETCSNRWLKIMRPMGF